MPMTTTRCEVRTDGTERIPFRDRLTCSVDDACDASGLSRSLIYQKLKSGEIESKKVNSRRLIVVPSLIRLLRA